MERWDIDRYRRPALVPCELALASDDDVLTIGVGDDAVDLSFEGVARDEVADVVTQLMRPASDIWTQLNHGACPEWIRTLTVQLDALSLIEETDSGFDSVTADAEHAIALCAEVGQRLAAVVERRIETYKDTLTVVYQMLVDEAQTRDGDAAIESFPFAGSFALQGIHFQLTYARQNAPELFIAWQRVLGEVFRRVCWYPASTVRTPGQKEPSLESFRSVAALDSVDLEMYLLSFAHFVEIAPLRVGRRMTSVDPEHTGDACSGLTLAARAERMLVKALDQLGANAYTSSALASKTVTPLIKGLYIEQYHVTDRFVEILGPLLSRRMKRNLRTRLFRYFQEEYGHEAFELATCVALGMNEADVRASVPLPLTALYIDAYTVLAQRLPTAFFASIMVTEGLRDQHSPVHEHISQLVESTLHAGDIAAKHGETNDELNHPSLSRLFLADVPHVAAAEQRYSLEAALFMLEVNMRQLESVAFFYGDQTQLRFHGLHHGRRTLDV